MNEVHMTVVTEARELVESFGTVTVENIDEIRRQLVVNGYATSFKFAHECIILPLRELIDVDEV